MLADETSEQLEPYQLFQARNVFNHITWDCEPSETKNGSYNRVSLVRLTHQYAPSPHIFLCYFFKWIREESNFFDAVCYFTDFVDWDSERKRAVASSIASFADFLVDNFFLPCKMTNLASKSDTNYL